MGKSAYNHANFSKCFNLSKFYAEPKIYYFWVTFFPLMWQHLLNVRKIVERLYIKLISVQKYSVLLHQKLRNPKICNLILCVIIFISWFIKIVIKSLIWGNKSIKICQHSFITLWRSQQQDITQIVKPCMLQNTFCAKEALFGTHYHIISLEKVVTNFSLYLI